VPEFDLANAVNVGLLVTLMAVFVAGLAAVLGIWMERDKAKPPRYAWALSALIVLATFVSLMQSYLDQREQDELKEDMARLLSTMDKLAEESDDPALKELVKSELTAQSRSNPEVIDKVAQRVSDEGRDVGEVLGRNLDAAEAEKVARKSSVKPKTTQKTDEKPKEKEEAKTEADEKQGAAAPTRQVPVSVPTAGPGGPRPGPVDAATAARMNMAAAAQAGAAPSTPPAPGTQAVAAPVPTPTDAKAPAPRDAKAGKGRKAPGKRTTPTTAPRGR
jgi:hypothetical protein